jgi:hypothetical protein
LHSGTREERCGIDNLWHLLSSIAQQNHMDWILGCHSPCSRLRVYASVWFAGERVWPCLQHVRGLLLKCHFEQSHRKVRGLQATRCLAPFSAFCHILKSIWNAYCCLMPGRFHTVKGGCSRSFCEVEQHSSSPTERTPLLFLQSLFFFQCTSTAVGTS